MTARDKAPSLEKVLETAMAAAREAGAILADGWRRPKDVRYKGEIDPVTEYDLASEKIIVARIGEAFPGHHIVAEEGGDQGGDAPFRWYVDPLDGTVNFAHKFPFFCVSIAFEAPGSAGPETRVGVVYDPVRDEMFQAIKGRGAYLNGECMEVTDVEALTRGLAATGFPYDVHENHEKVLLRLNRMILAAQGVRRAGSAALDLAYTAAGRFDVFWEERLKPWDFSAGVLLVEEAGGRATDFSGRPIHPQSKEILATNGHLHYNVLKILGCEGVEPNLPHEANPREGNE